MQVAICTDIHGNRHAFEAVIDAAETAGAEELWCLGDLVGYGAEPDACVALAREHCTIVLAGNHDLAVVEVLSLEDFSRGAALAARWTQEVISDETREFLLGLEPSGVGRRDRALPRLAARSDLGVRALRADRGAVLRLDRLPRLDDRPLARRALLPPPGGPARDGHDAARGHRARPVRGRVARQPRFHRPAARRRPARGLAAAGHARARPCTYKRAEYDIAGAQAAIRAARLPDSLAERLQYGQ